MPLEVRRQLGLKQGDKVIFQLAEGAATLVAAASRIGAGYQSIPALDRPRSEREIEVIAVEERAQAFRDQGQARDA